MTIKNISYVSMLKKRGNLEHLFLIDILTKEILRQKKESDDQKFKIIQFTQILFQMSFMRLDSNIDSKSSK